MYGIRLGPRPLTQARQRRHALHHDDPTTGLCHDNLGGFDVVVTGATGRTGTARIDIQARAHRFAAGNPTRQHYHVNGKWFNRQQLRRSRERRGLSRCGGLMDPPGPQRRASRNRRNHSRDKLSTLRRGVRHRLGPKPFTTADGPHHRHERRIHGVDLDPRTEHHQMPLDRRERRHAGIGWRVLVLHLQTAPEVGRIAAANSLAAAPPPMGVIEGRS